MYIVILDAGYRATRVATFTAPQVPDYGDLISLKLDGVDQQWVRCKDDGPDRQAHWHLGPLGGDRPIPITYLVIHEVAIYCTRVG